MPTTACAYCARLSPARCPRHSPALRRAAATGIAKCREALARSLRGRT